MEFKNCIIVITGFPGSGKLTTAQELANRYSFKLLANYHINKNILDLIEREQNTIPSDEVWQKIEVLWDTMLTTIGELSPSHYSFVITRPLIHDMPYSQNFYQRIQALAGQRKSLLVPVRLECGENELVQRIQSEKRKQLGKVIDPNRAAYLSKNQQVFRSHHPNEITIDNTQRSTDQTIQLIISHLEKLELDKLTS